MIVGIRSILPRRAVHRHCSRPAASTYNQRFTSRTRADLYFPGQPAPPKAGRCAAHPAQRPSLGEKSRQTENRLSQGGSMCHLPCARSLLGRIWPIRSANAGDSGATSRLGRKTRAQDPSLGEMSKGPTHLPAQTQTVRVGQIPAPLPSQDVVQKQGQNSSPSTELLPSRDDAQLTPARLPRPTPSSQGETMWRRTGAAALTRRGCGFGPVVTGKTVARAVHSPCARHRRAARIKDCWRCSRNRWRALPATLGFRAPPGRGRASHL